MTVAGIVGLTWLAGRIYANAALHPDLRSRNGAIPEMRALALLLIVIGAVLVVVTRVRRNTPGAIVAYAVLGIGLLLGLLTR